MVITTRFNDRAFYAQMESPCRSAIGKIAVLAALGLIFLLVIGPMAMSQAFPDRWVGIGPGKIKFHLNTSQDTLVAGQQFSVDLFLMAPANAQCMGAFFEVELSGLVNRADGTPWTLPAGCWLGNASDLTVGISADATEPMARWEVSRIDHGTRAGSGEVLSIMLEVGTAPVAALDVVQALDGGLILAENMDLKRPQQSAEEVAVKVFPNPFSQVLQVETGNGPVALQVINAQGKIVLETTVSDGGSIATDNLQPGFYLVRTFVEGAVEPTQFSMVKR